MLANGVESVGCPTWVPEGSLLDYVKVWHESDSIKFLAAYSGNSGEMFIRVTQYSDDTSSSFEKEEGGYVYIHNDIEFDIMENLDSANIEWQIGAYAYSVTGCLNSNEIEFIINSIGEVNLR